MEVTHLDEISLTAYRESYSRTLLKCFAAWSKITPEEWATEIYRLPNGKRFRFEYAPYLRGMMRSIFDARNKSTTFQIYSRGGKSAVILVCIGYVIDQAPRKILVMWPTVDDSEKFSREALCGELFDSTPCLNRYGTENKSRSTGNTMLYKAFPGGSIIMVGANAPGALRRAKAPFLYADEIDSIKGTQTDEGDILRIFAKRGGEFPDTIQVYASYPSWKGASRVESRMANSDFKEWHSTCVLCGGEPFVMSWDHLIYEEGREKDARLTCPRCKGLLDDSQRYDMAHKQGFDNWKARNEFNGHSGFFGSSVLWPHPIDLAKTPGGYLQIYAEQLTAANHAENPRKAMQTIFNMERAESFDPVAETEQPPSWKAIFDRREDYGLTVPSPGLFLTAYVDVQRNRLEVEWKAWGREEESWSMDHRVLDGYTSHPEVWEALKREFRRVFAHASGAQMTLGMGMIDGGAYSEDVYRFLQDLARNPMPGVSGKVRATKGLGKFGTPIIVRKMATVARTLKGHHIGTWQAKDYIYERLRMQSPTDEAGKPLPFIHYNRQFGEEFFQQLTVEKVVIEYEGGQEVRKYENPQNARNEALDLEVGNLAAVRLFPRNWDLLEEELKEAAQIGPSVPATSGVVNVASRSGWRL